VALTLAAAGCSRTYGQSLDHVDRWWIVLGNPEAADESAWFRAFEGAELAVVNQARPVHPPPGTISTLVLAYVSIGEAETSRAYWPQVQGRSYVIEKNPDWPDNFRVDIRDRRWQSILLDEEIPRLLAAGYQGIMLDTLDTAPYLERRDPVRFEGSRDSLREFLSVLRRTFPKAVLLANGTDTLVDAAPYVNGYVTEGIFATYDRAPLRYRRSTPTERDWRLNQVTAALARARRPVFAIEYADRDAPDGLSEWASSEAPGYQRAGRYFSSCASRSPKYVGTLSQGFGSVSPVTYR
jgi:hypothetical protein